MLVLERRDFDGVELITSDGVARIYVERVKNRRVRVHCDAPIEIKIHRIDRDGNREIKSQQRAVQGNRGTQRDGRQSGVQEPKGIRSTVPEQDSPKARL